MYRAMVEYFADIDFDEVGVSYYIATVILSVDDEEDRTLKRDLVSTDNEVVPAGTKFISWHVRYDPRVDFFHLHLYPDQNSVEEDSPIICKVAINDVFGKSKDLEDRLLALESRYKELEERHKDLEEKYNDLYNRPPELGGPGYIEAMEDFDNKRNGSN